MNQESIVRESWSVTKQTHTPIVGGLTKQQAHQIADELDRLVRPNNTVYIVSLERRTSDL